MKNMLLLFLQLLCCSFFSINTIWAQSPHNYTDYKPQYRKWLDSYILDKITYQPDRTIFYFRFVCDNTSSGGAIFYPPGGEFPWYLKGKGGLKEYNILAVKNVRSNGHLVKDVVDSAPFHSDPVGKIGHTVFSCEVHFPRLSDDMKEADLIEGKGQEYNRRHFNCFNIKLKTWNDEDLGDESDSQEQIEAFEKKYKAVSTNKETPNASPVANTTNNPSPPTPEMPEVVTATPPKDPYENITVTRLSQTNSLACGERIILDDIKFHDNSTQFKGMIKANQTLNIIFDYMRDNPNSRLTLYGHSDIFGSKERNLELSKQRVIKIQRWLTMYGIKGHRIDYKWYGSDRPLVKEGSIINRRVEISLVCQE